MSEQGKESPRTSIKIDTLDWVNLTNEIQVLVENIEDMDDVPGRLAFQIGLVYATWERIDARN